MFLNLLQVFLWKNIKRILFFRKTYFFGIAIPLVLITFVFVTRNNNSSAIRDFSDLNFESNENDLDGSHAFENLNVFWAPKTNFNTELMYRIFSNLNLPQSGESLVIKISGLEYNI